MNITALVQAISLLSSAIPVISGLITQVETLLPNAPGSDKFKVVEAAVHEYFSKFVADADVLAHILPKIGATINALVAMFNAAGVFNHATDGVNKAAGQVNAVIGGAQAALGAITGAKV
jgi:hypothetical protein